MTGKETECFADTFGNMQFIASGRAAIFCVWFHADGIAPQ